MAGFYEKRKMRRYFFSKPVVALLGLVALFLGHAAYNAWEKASNASLKRLEASAELAELEVRDAMLTTRIERLETPRGTEEEIRKQFDVGKKGEQVIVLVEKERVVTEPTLPEKEKGFFAKFFGWF